MNRFIGHSQVVTTNNYTTLRFCNYNILNKIFNVCLLTLCLVMNLIWLPLQLLNCLLNSLTNESLTPVWIWISEIQECTAFYNCHAAEIEVTMSYSSSVLLCYSGNHVLIPKQRFSFLSVYDFQFPYPWKPCFVISFQETVSPWQRTWQFVS
jgi:hypothetical protein